MLMKVLSLTADRDATAWQGLLLILLLFFVNILATSSFVAGSTISHITGTYLHQSPRQILYIGWLYEKKQIQSNRLFEWQIYGLHRS